MSTVRTILQQKRLPLLNLLVRSALLHYRQDSRYGLALSLEDISGIYRQLVVENVSLEFGSTDSVNGISEGDGLHGHKLHTGYTASELLNRLFYTLNRSQSTVEDYGKTLLFMGLGMFRSSSNVDAEGTLQAPLFLVPVSLTREDIQSPIMVRATGEDPLLNPALRIMLSKDYGIELPQWSPFQEDSLGRCIEQIAAAISIKSGWHLDRRAACVDFFDTDTVLKYLDLDPDDQVISDFDAHVTLKSLLLEGFDNEGVLDDEGLSVDMLVEPGEQPQPLDANNEQQLVVYHAMNGGNILVESTRGAGATQTIANLVATALSKERKILVVSNKGTALEDLQQRLRSVGLDHLSLPLFGSHLQRRTLMHALGTTAPINDRGTRKEDVSVETMVRSRNRLNIYANSMHTSIRESGVSPFKAYSQLTELSHSSEGTNFPSYNGSKFVQWSQSEFESFLDDVKALQNQFARIGIAQRHPFWGSRKTVYNAALKAEIQQKCRNAGMALNAVRATSSELGHMMGARAPTNSDDVIRLVRSASRAFEAPDLHGVSVHSERWESSMEQLAVVLETGSKIAAIREKFDNRLIPEAWGQDVLAIRQALVAHGGKKTRLLIGDYRKARDKLAGLCREGIPKTNQDQLQLVNGILEVQRLQGKLDLHEELAQSLYGRQWQGLQSNWDHLDRVTFWLIQLHQDIDEGTISAELLDFLIQFPNLDRLRKKAERVAKDFNTFLESSRQAAREVGMEEALGLSKASFGRMPFGTLLSLFAHWEKHLDTLQDIVAFNHQVLRLKDKGMEEVVKIAVSWSESARHLSSCIEASRYKALLTDALKARRSLSGFDQEAHEQVLEQFVALDTAYQEQLAFQIQHVQAERFAHQKLPSNVVRALIYELEEPPRRTLRELMADAGHAVQDVKPVFLMTPSSVASLLADSNVQFDLVIFDEAGNLSITDALGAVIRSSQIVAFGDSQESLPEDFFTRVPIGNSEERYATPGQEGLLEFMTQKGAIEHRFTWQCAPHIGPLVHWVNKRQYDERLFLYPLASKDRVISSLQLHDVSHSNHTNNGSGSHSLVSKMVSECLKHIVQAPDRTFGIVMQTVEEVESVEWEIERRIRKNPEIGPYIQNPGGRSLLVKTIEQAQGDLRDYVYAGLPFRNAMRYRNSARQVAIHSTEKVERQLSILAFLGMEQMHVYVDASLQEMEQWASQSPDMAVWEQFVQWLHVHMHTSEDKVMIRGPRTAYFAALAKALEERGYKTEQGVGFSGVFVDVAVLDPRVKGSYILGILGDGDQYHKANTVRDRDRLQPALLERNGWNLYRLWSIEWFRNPGREVDSICASLESILASREVSDGTFVPQESTTINTNGSLSSVEKID